MSLQSRLAAAFSAVGADIKFLNTQLTGMGGMPVQVIDGGATPLAPADGFTAVSNGEMPVHEHPHSHDYAGPLHTHDYAATGHGHDYAATGHSHTMPTAAQVGALPAAGKAVDSDKLDGLDSTAFLRSTAKAADSELLDGIDSSGFIRNQPTTTLGQQYVGYNFQGETPITADILPQSFRVGISVGAGVPGGGWPSIPGLGSAYGLVETVRVNGSDAIQTFKVFYNTGSGSETAIFQRSANGEGNSWKKWRRLDTDWSPFFVEGNGTPRDNIGNGNYDILNPHTFYGPESGKVLIQGFFGLEVNFGGGIADLFLSYNIDGRNFSLGHYAESAVNQFRSYPVLCVLSGLTPGAAYSNGSIGIGMTSQTVRYPGTNRGAAPSGVRLLFTPLSR